MTPRAPCGLGSSPGAHPSIPRASPAPDATLALLPRERRPRKPRDAQTSKHRSWTCLLYTSPSPRD
eukprot:8337802-Alexandrium_andersonii.AAC.1